MEKIYEIELEISVKEDKTFSHLLKIKECNVVEERNNLIKIVSHNKSVKYLDMKDIGVIKTNTEELTSFIYYTYTTKERIDDAKLELTNYMTRILTTEVYLLKVFLNFLGGMPPNERYISNK